VKATRELIQEHEGITLMLKILDAVVKKAQQGTQVPQEDLDGIVEFLTVFVDKCHHGKEEDFLFPELEKLGIPKENGPIGVMLSEHEEGRGLIADLKAAVAAYKGGDSAAVAAMSKAAEGYIFLLNAHINKENNVLFAMADNHLNAEKDDWLKAQFDALELERIGAGKHEAFHAMIHRLEKAYL